MQWNTVEVPEREVRALSTRFNISPCMAHLILARGFGELEDMEAFLQPRLAHLRDPFELKNLDKAVERLCEAVLKSQKVTVIGDYDVDGVTSTTLFVQMVRHFGLKPRYVVPRRLEEGYGLTREIIDRVFELHGKPDLMVVLDCGTNSIAEVDYLVEQGIDVVIIDHHKAREGYVENAVLVNPHVFDPEDAPWRNMCTVGLVFKWMHGFLKLLRSQGNAIAQKIRLRDYLDLVALGTVADLVPLLDENRILTRIGLQVLRGTDKPGLHALFQVSGLPGDQPIAPTDVAFRLSPRINASGRLADAALPVEMLLGEHYLSCLKKAEELDRMNAERQGIERGIVEEALAQVESSGQAEAPAILVFGQDWHSGVVGIVAGKLVQHYRKPVIVLAKDETMARGSGRTVHGVNLVEALSQCDDLLGDWGGHPMAVGVSCKVADVDALRTRFSEVIAQMYPEGFEETSIDIDYWLRPDQLTPTLLEELESLGPFGMSNRQPTFGVRSVILKDHPMVFAQKHFRFNIPQSGGRTVSGVAWKMADRLIPAGKPVDLAVKFNWNSWNGRRTPQIEVLDWR